MIFLSLVGVVSGVVVAVLRSSNPDLALLILPSVISLPFPLDTIDEEIEVTLSASF